MAGASAIALRFQRDLLLSHAGLSAAGRCILAEARGPQELIAALVEQGDGSDAVQALTQILPHRQTVWWACLGVRLLPDLDGRKSDGTAVHAAETWVQQAVPDAAIAAQRAAEACDPHSPAYWTAMGAFWSGPSLVPGPLEPVRPAGHLPGIATRTALLLTIMEPALGGRLKLRDLLAIGLDLMAGNLGRLPQAALAAKLAGE